VGLTNEQKGRRAKEILEDEVFVEVIHTAKEGILAQWNLTDFGEADLRERLHHQSRAIDEILRELRTLVADWTMDQSRSKPKRGQK
jgi:glycerol-3-phosphate O-acyltransferase